jgi:hypothetical protein
VYRANLTDLNRKKTLEAFIPMGRLSIMDVLDIKPTNQQERIELLLQLIRFESNEDEIVGDEEDTEIPTIDFETLAKKVLQNRTKN